MSYRIRLARTASSASATSLLTISPPQPAWFVWDNVEDDDALDGPYSVIAAAFTAVAARWERRWEKGKAGPYVDWDVSNNSALEWVAPYFLALWPDIGRRETPWAECKYAFFTEEAAREALKERRAEKQATARPNWLD